MSTVGRDGTVSTPPVEPSPRGDSLDVVQSPVDSSLRRSGSVDEVDTDVPHPFSTGTTRNRIKV